MPRRAQRGRVRPGDALVHRITNEPLTVLAIVDAAGTLLVCVRRESGGQVASGRDGDIDGASFQVHADEVARPEERHEGCGCCG
jgi:hypothetical protein